MRAPRSIALNLALCALLPLVSAAFIFPTHGTRYVHRSKPAVMGLFDFLQSGDADDDDTAANDGSAPKGMATVAHILLSNEEDAAALKARIEAGELSFGAAAAEFSLCRSKGKAGELGTFYGPSAKLNLGLGRVWNLPYEGKPVPEFDSLVFDSATEVGVIQQVVTSYGVHLVIVRARGD